MTHHRPVGWMLLAGLSGGGEKKDERDGRREENEPNERNAAGGGEGGSRRTRANDREGAGRAPVRDRRTEGRERRRKDRGGARGAGDAATFSLYIRGATHSDHPAPPRRLCFQSRTKNSLLSRGKKIHRGVTWRIRKLPTCDAGLKTRTTSRSARPRPSPPVAEAYGPARLLEKPPGSPCLPSPAPPRRCVPGRRSGPRASRTPRRARAEARRARGGKRTTPGCLRRSALPSDD